MRSTHTITFDNVGVFIQLHTVLVMIQLHSVFGNEQY